MHKENVLTKRIPSENILRLRELTDSMTQEEGQKQSLREAFDEISAMLGLEPKNSAGELDRLRFYERVCKQIKKILNNI